MKTQRTLNVTAKCSDLFTASLTEKTNNESESNVNRSLGDYHGYVPHWFPNPESDNYGDYVVLEIDLNTGKILNYKKPTEKQLKEIFKHEPRD